MGSYTSGNAELDHQTIESLTDFIVRLLFIYIHIAKVTYFPRAITNVRSFIKHQAGNHFSPMFPEYKYTS